MARRNARVSRILFDNADDSIEPKTDKTGVRELRKAGMKTSDAKSTARRLKGIVKDSRLAIMPTLGYPVTHKDQKTVVAATTSRRNKSTKKPPGTLGRSFKEEPRGTSWAAIVARGLIRWRHRTGLTASQAAAKSGIPVATWYRIEHGHFPETTGVRLDAICETFGINVVALMAAGEKEEAPKVKLVR